MSKWLAARETRGISVSVFVSVLDHLRNTFPDFAKYFSVHVACDHGSILFWKRCNALCTSGFVDDVMFSCNGPYGRMTQCRCNVAYTT